MFDRNPHGKDRRIAKRVMDIKKRDFRKRANNHPSAAMPLFGSHITGIAQPCHRTPNHNRIGIKHPGNHVGRHRPAKPIHMDQDVQHAGKATVTAH